MASVYDVNAAIAKPNLLASMAQGWQFGEQRRQTEEARAKQNQLQALGPAAVRGDPAALAQAAVIDPSAAQGWQQFADQQLTKLRGALDYLDRARSSGNPNAINAALQQVGPYFSQLTGQPAPTSWTPDMDAEFEQLRAMVAMVPGQPAADPKVIAPGAAMVRPDGTVVYQNPATPPQPRLVNVPDGQGGFVQMWADPASRSFAAPEYPSAPQGAPAAAPAAPVVADPSSMAGAVQALVSLNGGTLTSGYRDPARNAAVGGVPNSQHMQGTGFDAVIPPENKAQYIAQMRQLGFEAIDEGDHIHVELPSNRGGGGGGQAPRPGYTPPPRQAAPSGFRYTPAGDLEAIPGGPADKPAGQFRTLTPEEIRAQGLPEGAVAQVGPDGRVNLLSQPDAQTRKAAREAAMRLPQLQAAIRRLARIDGAIEGLSNPTGTPLDRILPDTGPLDQFLTGVTPAGNEFENAVAQMQPTLLALTRVPGIGAQSDLETRLANMQYPGLGNRPETNRRAVQELRLFIRDLAAAYASVGDESTASQIQQMLAELDGATPAAAPPSGAQGGFRILNVRPAGQ